MAWSPARTSQTLRYVSDWASEEQRLRRRLAANVRALRIAQDRTVEAVAHDAGMHWRHWQKIEAGEVGLTLRSTVALNVSAAELLR